jgi:NitT/TauT family transport system substrate-binding protein
MKKLNVITLFVVIISLLFSSCATPAVEVPVEEAPAQVEQPAAAETKAELVKVVYGVSPFQDTYLPALGKDMGWYEEEGLDVEFKVLGWTEVQEALAAGEVDVAINNISSVIAIYENWPQFVFYYGFNIFDAGAALMGKPEFKSVDEFKAEGMSETDAIKAAAEQMKGKVVVTTGNTDMEQAVLGTAYRNGLDFTTDFEVVDMNPDEGLAAFLSGTGDFFLGGIPQRTRATKEGYKPIIMGAQLAPPPLNGIVTTKEYAANNEETLLKLIKVWFRIANYVQNNTDEAGGKVVAALNEQTGANMTVDDFKSFWQNWEHYPLSAAEVQRDIIDPSGYSYWKARFDDSNWYFYDIKGSIKAPVAAEDAIMLEQVQKAYIAKYGE